MAMPVWLKEKTRLPSLIREGLGGELKGRLVFTDHHESHAASAFFPSPFDEAAILTLDGVGEWSTTTMGVGRGNRIELTTQLQFPHSLGLLYSAFTYYCGFKVNSGEYKLMGLAPYGRPVYKDLITRHLIDLRDDGSFWLDMQYFNYCQGLTMTNGRFDELFGGPPRNPESDIAQRHMDLAASIQAVTEDVMLAMGRRVFTPDRDEPPGAGRRRGAQLRGQRAAAARGAVRRHLDSARGRRRRRRARRRRCSCGTSCSRSRGTPARRIARRAVSWGRDSRRATSAACSISAGATYQQATDEDDLMQRVVDILCDGKIVGWFQGRMEFGPRALGARSILGDPRSAKMQATMNLKIKFRESFRPFAPIVLQEEAHKWFALEPGQESPYMLLVAPVLDEHRVPVTERTARDHGRGPRPAQPGEHPALDDSGGDPRRLQRAGPDRGRDAKSPHVRGCFARSSSAPAVRCW